MKEYSHLLESTDGVEFAKRTFDASEFLYNNGLADMLESALGLEITATYHDACHLSHGQRITKAPRDLIAAIPHLQLVPLAEADMCCGSAGIYNVIQPDMARKLVDRKYENISQTVALWLQPAIQDVILGSPKLPANTGNASMSCIR